MIVRTALDQLSPHHHRNYPLDLLNENITRLQSTIEGNRFFGTIADDNDEFYQYTLEKISHQITKLSIEGNDLVAEVKILETPEGKILSNLVEIGTKFRLGLVGYGIVNENDQLEEYTLDRIDLIGDLWNGSSTI